METLISGIIDYVARPSTTDSPVRVLRKSSSESPTCVSAEVEVGLASPDSVAHLGPIDSDSEASCHTFADPPANERSLSTSSLLSRLSIPATVTPFNSVLTAEGIITGYCGGGATCGDCAACYDGVGDAGTITSESIDAATVRQFEAAFAAFLYKHPAFTSMSHVRLQKLRSKLLRESAKNMKAERELQKQLAELREAKFNRELELQQELLAVTRAKTAREAEMICLIEKTKRSSMLIDNQVAAANSCSSVSTLVPSTASATSQISLSPHDCCAPLMAGSSPSTSSSYEVFQNEIKKNKMEQAHILAEMEKIKMQIAEESVYGTP